MPPEVEMLKLVTKNVGIENSHTLSVARSHGAYSRLEAAFAMTPEALTAEVIKSNLRGLGGAGFPAGRKWSFLPKDSPKPRYLVVNGDEGEPGTCKDKIIMIHDPHLLIEGIIITCWAIQSHKAFIYIRGEYDLPVEHVEQAIVEAKAAGILGETVMGHDFALDIVVHRGAGAYICGEETALLESLEGKRGWPRLKPPFPAVEGYMRCPTVVNNVETLSYVPYVVEMGAQPFADLGSERNGGLRMYSISGRVNRPGVYELPMGTPLREMIYDHAQGVTGGRALKAVIPGGSSAPILTPDEIDVPMDFDSLAKRGTMLGSAGVIVFDETVSMVEALKVIIRFYAHESCGQCTPCREGTAWLEKIVERILDLGGRPGDVDNMLRISRNIMGNTICPFGDGAALPVVSCVTKFRPEFEAWVRRGQPVTTLPVREAHIGEPVAAV
ncbi:MAG: NADH-quinone oxidoreductase subunit NuoF [candidate division Zixibacteria bacterium]|nr:NADH-quinone oxidoreductase subunit NuoF [candidate division Zixibacteria bacterium]